MKIYKRGRESAGVNCYVGRGSEWGNPYVIGRDGDRDLVIAKFEAYAEERIQAEPEWLKPLKDMDGLVCYCAPLRCHAEILIKLI